MPGSDLNLEVAELLQRTDNLIRTSVADRALSEFTRKSVTARQSFRSPLSSGSAARTSFVRSSTDEGTDALSEAASRLRGSFDAASRKLEVLKEAPSLTVPPGFDALRKIGDVAGSTRAPRLSETFPSRPEPSIASTEPKTASLDQGGSWLLNTSLPGTSAGEGRTYNSFGGLQDMVSMVNDITGAPSPRHSHGLGASNGTKVGGSLRPSLRVVGGSRGSGVVPKLFGSSLKSPSRVSSPSLSPRAPPPKATSVPASAPPAALTSATGSRRAQLQSLLSKDLAQPYDVVKFKSEAHNYAQPPVDVQTLAGSLQEKFDRVQRKLKNWEVVETTATERFNKALDAALDALFSRVNLAWPSGDDLNGTCGAPASTSARVSSQSRSSSKGHSQDREQQGMLEKKLSSGSGRRSNNPLQGGGQRDGADDSGYDSPSSSASRRDAWDDLLDSTSEAAMRLRPGSDGGASGGGLHHGSRKTSRSHGKEKDKSSSRQHSGRRHQDVPTGVAYQMRGTGDTFSDAAGGRIDNAPCTQYLYTGPGIETAAQRPGAVALAGPSKAVTYMMPGAPYASASLSPAAMLASMGVRPASAPMYGAFAAQPTLYPAAPVPSNSTAVSAPAAASAAAPFLAASSGAHVVSLAKQAAALPTSASEQQVGDSFWKSAAARGGTLRLVPPGPWTQPDPLTAAAQQAFPATMRQTYDDSTSQYLNDHASGSCTVPQFAPSSSASHVVLPNGPLPMPSAAAISAPIQAVWPSVPTHSTVQVTSRSVQEATGSTSSAAMSGYAGVHPGAIFALPNTMAGYGTGVPGPLLSYFGKAEMGGSGPYPNV